MGERVEVVGLGLATLDVLAGLTDKTQVLFFTHHWHLVELAGNSRKPHLEFTLHRLGSLSGV